MKLTFLLILVGLISAFANVEAACAQTSIDAKAAADSAYESLIANFWESGRGDFTGNDNYWFYAQSIDVASLAYARTQTDKNLKRIQTLYSQQAKRGFLQGASVFYDDENWMALSLARAYELTGRSEYLKTSLELFHDVQSGEHFDPNGQTLGIWWSSQHTGSATASTAGSVITACVLHRITGDAAYLDFAQRVYTYWRNEMTDSATHLVYDFKKSDGQREMVSYTYGQGLMVGAAVELYRATKQASYLAEARGYSRYVLTEMNHNGILREPFCETNWDRCTKNRDVAQFKGIAVRYLVELALVDPKNLELRRFLDSSISALVNPKTRDSKTGRFSMDWEGKDPATSGIYPATNSAALALAAYATLL